MWSSKPAQHRCRFLAPSSGNRRKGSKFTVLFDTKPQHHPGEIPIGSDMIHVSGGGRKDDFLDDPLAPPKPDLSIDLVQRKEFREINSKLRRIYQSKLLN